MCQRTEHVLEELDICAIKVYVYVMKNVNKSLFNVWPILNVISFLDNANVLLCNYAGIQVMMILQ